MVLHVKLTQPTLNIDSGTSASDEPAMRWCNFPGERLLKSVRFDVNGNPLDSYTTTTYNFHREFCVQPNKETGYYRCVGQELPNPGYMSQPIWNNSNVSSSSITSRFKADVSTGWQTPTGQKTGYLEMFIPLLNL